MECKPQSRPLVSLAYRKFPTKNRFLNKKMLDKYNALHHIADITQCVKKMGLDRQPKFQQ